MKPENLTILQLADGLPSQIGKQEVRYKTVHLRETAVEDEMKAVEMAERVVMHNGKPMLLMSNEVYRVAYNMRHIEKFVQSGFDDIELNILNLKMIGMLSPHDMHLIEERILLIEMAKQVRYGLMTQEAFDRVFSGAEQKEAAHVPRPEGQIEGLGEDGTQHQSGPQRLSDNTADSP